MSTEMEPGQEWDAALQKSQQRLASGITNFSKRKRLPFLRFPLTPTILPSKNREIAMISDDLRDKLRGLVIGELDWPFFAWGGTGCGKTCAALALLDYTGGVYFTVPDLSAKVNAAMQGKLTTIGENGCAYECSVGDFWAKIAGSPLTVLDELGLRGNVSEAESEKVKTLLDIREGKPLICLSNLGPNELAAIYDARIVDRLMAGTAVEVTGASRR